MMSASSLSRRKNNLFKHCLIVDALVLALALSFAAQIGALSIMPKNNFAGVVYGANNVPIVGAYVSAFGDNGSGSAITNSNGQYTISHGLKSGTYNVSVSYVTGYVGSKVGGVIVTAGQTTTDVNFDLQLSGGISGIVTDAVSGNPLNGTLVYSTLANGTAGYGSVAITGLDGTYSMATDMPTGTYNVTVGFPKGHVKNSTTVSVTSGNETKNVNFALVPSGIISGRITAPDGTPVNATVSAISYSTMYYGYASTDANGYYSITSGLGTASDYMVSASPKTGSGYNYTMHISVTAGQETSGVDLELTVTVTPPTPSGTITGRVTDISNGNPIPDATVTASGSGGYGSNTTDSNGDYIISRGLGNGDDYNVTATASGYDEASYPTLVSVTVDLTTSGIDIQMSQTPPQEYGSISGTVTGPANAIPEFQYPIAVALSLTLIVAATSRLIIRTKRLQKVRSFD
jgi:hypothetical protein